MVLRQSLPSWAVLSLNIVGRSVLEVITDLCFRGRVIDTLRMIGIMRVPDFDFYGATKKRHGAGTTTQR